MEREEPPVTHPGKKPALRLRLDKANYGPDGDVVYLGHDSRGAIRQAHSPIWHQPMEPTPQKSASGQLGQLEPEETRQLTREELDGFATWKEKDRAEAN